MARLPLLALVLALVVVAVPQAGAKERPRTQPLPKASGPWAQRVTFALQEFREARRTRRVVGGRLRFRETASVRATRPRVVRPARPARSAALVAPWPARGVVLPMAGPPGATGPTCGNGVSAMSRLLDHDIGLVVTTSEAPNLAGIADGPGVLTKANCPAINALLPLMPTASGSFMYTGGHTVVTANVYADASRTGQPIWTGYYGTSPLGSVGPAQDANPLFDSVTGGGRFADAWNAGTGELVICRTPLDWLDTTGGCVRCDLSGYTGANATLKDANHGLRSATARPARRSRT